MGRMVGAGALIGAGLAVGTATTAGAIVDIDMFGTFAETDAGTALGYDINGAAQLEITAGGSVATIVVGGLDPDKTYGSHLHNGTCASGGGGHYQNEEGGATAPPNELWIANATTGLLPTASGTVAATGSAIWLARVESATMTNAASVVIHEPGGARIACADLPGNTARATFSGIVSETAAGAELTYDISGHAELLIRSGGTVVNLTVGGLDPAKTYGSHLHNGTCASGGGGHYQNEEGGATTPPNELWVTNSETSLVSAADGTATATGSATWFPRMSSTLSNARSVVIHEPGGARIACADLQASELTGAFAGMSGRNGTIARLYLAVFHRLPDLGGHAYWVGQSNNGVAVLSISAEFVASPEFVATYDSLDDTAFVNLLYNNVMNRVGDPAGVTYWKGILAGGSSRAMVVLQFSESPEFKVITGSK